jgi:hypothetical protein
MPGEHAKREMVTGEKLEASGKMNKERTPLKEATTSTMSTRRSLPAPTRR